jgi:hypothetical protein
LDFLLGRDTIPAGVLSPQVTLGCGWIDMSDTPVPTGSRSPARRSIGRSVLAGLVVLVAGYVLLKIVIGVAVALAGTVAVILAIVAIIWALKTLL